MANVQTISLLLPTRGRPELAQRALDSIAKTTETLSAVEVIVCVDEDDPASHALDHSDVIVKRIIVPRQNMGAYNAICLQNSSGSISIAINDDMVIRTQGWDQKIRTIDDQHKDGIYLAYSNDLFKGKNQATFPILSKQLTDLIEAPYPFDYKGAFIDIHLMDIFMRLKAKGKDRLVYIPDVVFEHLHFRTSNEIAFDETYADRNRFGDDETFVRLSNLRQSQADKMLAHIDKQSWEGPKLSRVEPNSFSPNLLTAPFALMHQLLLDTNLPVIWRTKLMIWMILRFYYNAAARLICSIKMLQI